MNAAAIILIFLSFCLGVIAYLCTGDLVLFACTLCIAIISSCPLIIIYFAYLSFCLIINFQLNSLFLSITSTEITLLWSVLQLGILLGFSQFKDPVSRSFLTQKRVVSIIRTTFILVATVLTTLFFFRKFPLYYGIWSIIFLFYAHRISAFQMRPLLLKGLGFIFFIAMIFIVLESSTRLILPVQQSQNKVFESDEELIYSLSPGASLQQVYYYNEGKKTEWTATISSQGIRDREYGPKKPDEFRIVTIGDSFTFGMPLSDPEHTFQRQLEKRLNSGKLSKEFKVINCGVTGYAPWQERLFLQKRGFDFEPDMVILQLFPANDIAGSYTKVGKRLRAYEVKWERDLIRYQRQQEWPFYMERLCQKYSNLYRVVDTRWSNLELVSRLMLACRFIPCTNYELLEPSTPRNPLFEVCLVHWYPELYEAWTIFEESIQQIRDDCRHHDIPLIAFVHGNCYTFQPEKWEQLEKEFPDTPYQKDKDFDLTHHMLTQLKIPHPDMVTPFGSAPNPEDLFYLRDGHFTPAGAALVAEVLHDFLLREYFP